jgi:RNA polymerase sigma-70 factor (ECF subfamily)
MGETVQALVARLFAEHDGALRRFFRRRVRREADVAELAQDVYRRMLTVSDPSEIRNPEAYMFTVANNLLGERAVLARRERDSVDVEDPTVQERLAEIPSFGGQIDTERRVRRLRQVLLQLTPDCRLAVVLHFWHQQTYEEIAERLGVSTNMVKKHLSNALVHCRRRMVSLR